MQYPQHIIYAVPNGGARNPTTGAMLKREGVRRGIPDLCIPIARGGYNSLYIELKNGKAGRLSDEQKNVIDYLRRQGHKVEVARDFEGFREIVNNYINS